MSEELQLPESLRAKLTSRGLESVHRRSSNSNVASPRESPSVKALPVSNASSPRDKKYLAPNRPYLQLIDVSEDIISSHEKLYLLRLSYGADFTWTVIRNLTNIEDLSRCIASISFNNHIQSPSFSNDDPEHVTVDDISEFIDDVIVYLGENWLHCDSVLSFFDDFAHKSVTITLKLRQAEEQIGMLEKINQTIMSKVSENESLTLAVYDIIRVLQYRVSEMEHVFSNKTSSDDHELPNRHDISIEQLQSVLQSISNHTSQRYSGDSQHHMLTKQPHDSLQSEMSHKSGLSVRTSIESPVISWPAPSSSMKIITKNNVPSSSQTSPHHHISSAAVAVDDDEFGNADSPFSPTTTDPSPSYHPYHDSLFSDSHITSSNHHQHPDDAIIADDTDDHRVNVGIIGLSSSIPSYFHQPGTLSKLNSDSNRTDFSTSTNTVNTNNDMDQELSALASSLAVMPSSLGSLWDRHLMPDHSNASYDGHSNYMMVDNPMITSSLSSSSSCMNQDLEAISSIIPWQLIPTNESPSTCDEAIEELITILRPHDPQLVYRSSAKSFLSKQVRRALGTRVFEIGLHSLRCFLPDDTLRLSVILWKNHSGHWHTHLSDRLCRLSEQGKILEDDIIDQNYDDIQSHMDHMICNVSYASSSYQHHDFRVFCTVDTLSVEISSNNRQDLCLLAFIEEVAIMIGKNNLLKRSIVLIRAWWVYETASYIGSPIKHYIPDLAMIMMIVAVFNKYHDRINYPLQALCFFLIDYSAIEWNDVAITIQGATSFKTTSSDNHADQHDGSSSMMNPDNQNQPMMLDVNHKHLIQASLLDKYWDIVNHAGDSNISSSSDPTSSDPASSDPTASSEPSSSALDGDKTAVDDNAIVEGTGANIISDDVDIDPISSSKLIASGGSVTGMMMSQPQPSSSSSFVLNLDKINTSRKLVLESFERRAINIINPLTNTNMMNDKLNARRAKRIAKVFITAAKNMHAVLKLASSPGIVSIQTTMKNFFRTSYTRFGSGYRPDVLGNMIWIKPTISMITTSSSSHHDDNNDHNNLWNNNDSWSQGNNNHHQSQAHHHLQVDKVDNEELRDADSELSDYSRDIMKISLDRLWDDILYCSLVLEGKITETALLILTKEILIERGTLPVGEIGKMLQELTSMTSLSSRLKEKFGGLKKFLERFVDHFVIGSDHPFNPHVYLRQNLTMDDFDVINRGTVPPQLLAKFKKMVVVRKKKVNALPPSSNNLDYGPWGASSSPTSSFPNMMPNMMPNPHVSYPPPPASPSQAASMMPPPPSPSNMMISSSSPTTSPMKRPSFTSNPTMMKQPSSSSSMMNTDHLVALNSHQHQHLSPLMFHHPTSPMDSNKLSPQHTSYPPPPSLDQLPPTISRIQEAQLGHHQLPGRDHHNLNPNLPGGMTMPVPNHREGNYYSYPVRRKSNAMDEMPSSGMMQPNLMVESLGINKTPPPPLPHQPSASYNHNQLQNQLVHDHMNHHGSMQHDEWNANARGAPPVNGGNMRTRSHPRNMYMAQPPPLSPSASSQASSSHYDMINQQQQHRDPYYYNQNPHQIGAMIGASAPHNDNRYRPYPPPQQQQPYNQGPSSSSSHYHY